MHCSSSYPLKNHEANLSEIVYLKNKYPKFKIGYSDHTIGIDASITALSLGAEVIEKHFTINKKYSKFRDHSLSADINDMRNIVAKSKIIKDLLKKVDLKKQNNTKTLNYLDDLLYLIELKNQKINLILKICYF